MGSLCCVASRPQGSNAVSRDWSVGPNEPYWQTNASFSPPPSRWDFRFQSEGLPHSLNGGIQFSGSSTSSNGKDRKGWVRGNCLSDLPCPASDGNGIFLSSPSDFSQGPQWTTPTIQDSSDDYETQIKRDPSLGRISFTLTKEGTSENPDSGGSSLSRSDSSESEFTAKSHLSSQSNFSSCHSFISKPIHPLSFPDVIATREAFDTALAALAKSDAATPQSTARHWSSASSNLDSADDSCILKSQTSSLPNIPSDEFRCSLCGRFLSQRSPWSSSRIVRSGDMPTTGVLSCCHVFHAECLEQTMPKTWRNDPPCPVCFRLQEGNCHDESNVLRLRNDIPRPGPFREDGPSRPWSCAQVSDCVEGALHASPHNALFLLSRNRIKMNLSLKGNINKEFPGKLSSGPYSSQLFIGNSADQELIAQRH